MRGDNTGQCSKTDETLGALSVENITEWSLTLSIRPQVSKQEHTHDKLYCWHRDFKLL